MRRPTLAALCVLTSSMFGCGTSDPETAGLTVFAAASMTEAFDAIGETFAAEHPEVDLVFSFASSSDLARQVTEGAPADVYVSADLVNMAKVTDAGANAGAPVVFATNRAEIVVAAGNPLGLADVADLATLDLVLVVCAPEVPCGEYASQVFDAAGVEVTPDSLEENVKAVVTKVTIGEADAGIVYATDVIAAGDQASGVEIPEDHNVVAEYPIVALENATNPDLAASFVGFVLGPTGQQLLESYGFGEP